MKLDNSNKRYSIIVVGILVIAALSIFVVFLIEFEGNHILKQDGVQLAYMGNPVNSNKPILFLDDRENKNVPVAKEQDFGTFDVASGSIAYDLYVWDPAGSAYDPTLPDEYVNINTVDPATAPFILPICLEDDKNMDDDTTTLEVGRMYITAEVMGGYTPYDGPCDGDLPCVIKFKSYKNGGFEGWQSADIVWVPGVSADPCKTLYIGYIDIDPDDSDATVECLTFDSSWNPDMSKYLDKDVLITVKCKWAGCGDWSQRFWQILVHLKIIFLDSSIPE